jgi:predicted glycosyltransferase
MKALFYAINGKGMGHLNRTLVLARALQAAAPGAEIRFAVVSPLFGLVQAAGFEVFKIPDRRHPRGFFVGRESRQRWLGEVFSVLCRAYRPEHLIVDMTLSVPVFSAAQDAGAQVALVLRKQRPETLKELRRTAGIGRVARFLVPHDPDEAPLAELPWEWRRRVRYLGPVRRELAQERMAPVRRKYAADDERLVVVTIGGGGFHESWRTLELAEVAARQLLSREETERKFATEATGPARAGDEVSDPGPSPPGGLRWVLVYGPYYPHDVPPSDERVSRVRFEPDLLELMAAADVVICNAGYNTIQELEVCRGRAIILPLELTGRDDQVARARRAEEQGLGRVCGGGVGELVGALRECLRSARPGAVIAPPKNGPEALGRRMLSALTGPP